MRLVAQPFGGIATGRSTKSVHQKVIRLSASISQKKQKIRASAILPAMRECL